MTIDEMIEVLQAAQRGETIQCVLKRGTDTWGDMTIWVWNFRDYNYRVKPEPLDLWVNVYPTEMTCYESRIEADKFATPKRIKCVHVREVVE